MCSNLQAQVPVHEEPVHKPVYADEKIRILNVLLPAGDTTMYHLHHTPSLFIFFTTTHTGSQLQHHEPQTSTSVAGHILFENLAAPHTRIHKVWNADTHTFHVMDIELLYPDSSFNHPPLSHPMLTLHTDTAWVRAYRLQVPKRKQFVIKAQQSSLVLVALGDAAMHIKSGKLSSRQMLKEGSFFHIAAGQSFRVKNVAGKIASFVLVELPIPG